MSINVYGFRWEFKEDEQIPMIFLLRLSDLEGEEVNLFYGRKQRDNIIDEYEIKNGKNLK